MEHCKLRNQVSEGSAATDSRWGGHFDPNFLCSRFENSTVKELLKSVFCQKTLANTNIAKIKVAPFLKHIFIYFISCNIWNMITSKRLTRPAADQPVFAWQKLYYNKSEKNVVLFTRWQRNGLQQGFFKIILYYSVLLSNIVLLCSLLFYVLSDIHWSAVSCYCCCFIVLKISETIIAMGWVWVGYPRRPTLTPSVIRAHLINWPMH